MDVLMPQLGETVAEGKIVKWFKSAGDAVKPGDNLFEIETDKTSMEVPATFAGTLTDIRFQVGEVAKVGAVVAVISDGSDGQSGCCRACNAPHQPRRAQVSLAPIAEAAAAGGASRSRSCATPSLDPWHEVRTPERNYGPARLPGGAVVTPLARRLAGERGIDLTRVRGSGPHGRIVARDVESAAAAAPARAIAAGATAAQVKALYEGTVYEEVPLDGMRATIARRLVEAKQTIPHFYLTADLEIDRLIALREEANAAAPQGQARAASAFKLSLNDFIIKAWAAALQRVPAANAVLRGGPHPAFCAFRHRRRGGARRRPDHAGDPRRRGEIAQRDIRRNARPRRARARKEAEAGRIPGRRRAPSPISACMACANSPPSSIRRRRPFWRSAPRAAPRWKRKTAASNSSAR